MVGPPNQAAQRRLLGLRSEVDELVDLVELGTDRLARYVG